MSGIVRQLVLLGVALCTTLVYLIISKIKRVSFSFRPWNWERGELEAALRGAQSYREWQTVAVELDRLQGRLKWRNDEASALYDHRNISLRYHALREAQLAKNTELLMMLLRENMVRNIGGIGNPKLFHHALSGTKVLSEQYAQTVVESIERIANDPSQDLALRERFLADSRQAYGRSALLLSGGLGLGMYHFGVVKCLHEEKLLPTVLCGTSIGALVVAMLGATPDDKLSELLERRAVNFAAFERLSAGSLKRKVVRLLTHGYIMDVQRLIDFCKDNVGELTFREAYELTGRTINIVLAHPLHSTTPALLNYLTAPNVLLWSAAGASCAQPGLYAPVALKAKDFAGRIVDLIPPNSSDHWVSTKADFPMQRLTELFNVNHFIVSQVQPHIIASLRSQRSSSRFSIAHRTAMFVVREFVHLIHVLSVLSNFAPFFGWVREEVEQTHEGHVTIIPHLSFTALLQIVGNPSDAKLKWCALEGEHGCFHYINQIRVCTAVERTLHANVRKLRAIRKELNDSDRALTEPQPASSSCLQPNAHSGRLDSLGRFVCPPTDVIVPRPSPPPLSSATAASTSRPDSPPCVVPQSSLLPSHHIDEPYSPASAAASGSGNISVSVSPGAHHNRSRSYSHRDRERDRERGVDGDRDRERDRRASTPIPSNASLFTPGMTSLFGGGGGGGGGGGLGSGGLGDFSSVHMQGGRATSPGGGAVSPSRHVGISPSRRTNADLMRTMSISSSMQSLVAPLTPGRPRRSMADSNDEASSVD